MLKFKSKRQSIFSIPPYDFRIFEIWREAFKIDKSLWIKLLLADLIFIIVFHSPVWMHFLNQHFPLAEAFKVNPVWLNTTPFLRAFKQLSIAMLPFLFTLFISVPLYLGINLMAIRAVYEKPVSLGLLTHYFSFFWCSTLVSLTILAGIVVVPIAFILRLFMMKAASIGMLPQLYVGLSGGFLFILVLLVMLCWVVNLVFAGRVNIADAIRMSRRAAGMRFWKMLAMIALLNLVQNAGLKTWYLSDILLFPPSMIAWALLYKHIFGEKGLVE